MSEGVDLSAVSIEFGSFKAVDNVSVDVRPGEFFSFLGPSGCGKTTILRMVSGFLSPSSGDIRIGGKSMKGIGPNRRPTALIFQNLALFPLMPVWENITFGLRVRGIGRSERRKRAEELLRVVDLPDAGDKAIGQLSGGQKQRIAIARALAVEPKVMLLDEPLSALDLKLRQHMRAELRAIQERTGVTFIYITHDQSEALAMSDRVAVMSRGKLQQVDTPQVIYNTPANGFVASFVGENTILNGAVDGEEGGFASFRTPDGRFKARPGPGVRNSGTTRLFVRPENVRLGSAENSLEATVTKVVFEGNLISVIGTTRNGVPIVAQFTNGAAGELPQIGSTARFSFDPERAQILVDDRPTGVRTEGF
ncbi:ABC transporter ATP-binding protein [Mesorhizobium sp. WSM4887]|uniref:ABC transporter ATP-binding protein n=1 Tax=Mesorhizobium sp. WSM4887 TaxID=3038543 RepID=UPI0024169B31|nr:ABC transporter ATP-binding protein [Mesorhizobium sp. WSM4887]MDG4886830.1 ABC transporter ATP-binding protein [Mesorhizobium sp. WSM4887]